MPMAGDMLRLRADKLHWLRGDPVNDPIFPGKLPLLQVKPVLGQARGH